jgi:hypothetical protein
MDKKRLRLGEPDMSLFGLELWIHGREFNNGEYWDENWLVVTLHYSSANSGVWLRNEPAVFITDLIGLNGWLRNIQVGGDFDPEFDFIEPHISFHADLFSDNKIELTTNITPDQVLESHRFTRILDVTELTAGIDALEKTLGKYPLIGRP